VGGFEHRSQPLAPRDRYLRRLLAHGGFAALLLGASLLIGVVGYHLTEGLDWLDALLNASMILGGMGPVDPVRSDAGKWFASIYALFSGVMFLVSVGVIFTPMIHRLLHRLHLEDARSR